MSDLDVVEDLGGISKRPYPCKHGDDPVASVEFYGLGASKGRNGVDL